MTPRPLRIAPALVPALLLTLPVTALVPTAHADGISGTGFTDPRGDVVFDGAHTRAQRRAADIREMTYGNDGAALTIATTVAEIAPTKGRPVVDTRVRERIGGKTRTVVLSTEVGSGVVMVATGSAFYPCEGSSASATSVTVTQIVPLSCLEGFSRPKLRSSASVVRRNGSAIAHDRARATRFDVTGARG